MLSDERIRQALHADRIVPIGLANPHGRGLIGDQYALTFVHFAPQ
jgi:hypothetical protein